MLKSSGLSGRTNLCETLALREQRFLPWNTTLLKRPGLPDPGTLAHMFNGYFKINAMD